MATVTLYVSSRKDDTKSTCCVTGQIKKKIQSKDFLWKEKNYIM